MADVLAPYGHSRYDTLPAEPLRLSGKAVASLVCGIFGILIPIVPSLLAVLFANDAQHQLKNTLDHRGENLALAGLALGWVGLGIGTAAAAIAAIHFVF